LSKFRIPHDTTEWTEKYVLNGIYAASDASNVSPEIEGVAYMIYHLMCQSPIVLQNIVVLHSNCRGDFLRGRQYLSQLIVGNVCQLGAVVFGYD
jgi:hypothetical protein